MAEKAKSPPKPWISPEEVEALPLWTCEWEAAPAEPLTVGQTLQVSCAGPSVSWDKSSVNFAPPEPALKYALRILEIQELSENSLKAEVTSYLVGEHELKNLPLRDATGAKARVEQLRLSVQTVIKDPNPQPYGPIPPMALNYPYWLGLAVAISLVCLLAWLGFRVRRRRQMAKVIEELKQHNTALGPFNQFNKDVRKLGRQYIFGELQDWSEQKKQTYIDSLDAIVRMYLLREFFVPALDWNSNLTLRTIAQQDKKRFPRYGSDLRSLLQELDQARQEAQKLKSQDCKQLTQMANKVSQKIWQARRGASQ